MPRSKPRRPNPLGVTAGFRSFVLDQLAEIDDLVPRSMFGGIGLYCRGVFFGIIAGDRLYLKADDSNRADYESAGESPFRPYPDRAGTMQYYSVPVAILESAPELGEWARRAIRVAERSGASPKKKERLPSSF
jgi:DNA transformation protein and related proteins